MRQTNIFTKGIISDIDYQNIDNQSWVFPTLNIRIFNKDGQGFVVTNTDGNEEMFEVSEGFIIIGADAHESILYLVCHNDGNGEGEIGCYPSPKEWSVSNTEFERKYKPLYNYKPAPVYASLSTILFNFSLDKQVDVFVRDSYDGSVNLYLTDNNNPIRVINSGFKGTGEWTGNNRYYTPGDFDGIINLIPRTKNIPSVYLSEVTAGGFLKPGNIYLFIRYVSKDYARTKFLTEQGPISIYADADARNIRGEQEEDWINNKINLTDKKINVTISNIDTSYKYLY